MTRCLWKLGWLSLFIALALPFASSARAAAAGEEPSLIVDRFPQVLVYSSVSSVGARLQPADIPASRRAHPLLLDGAGGSAANDTTRSPKSPLRAFGWSFGPTALAMGGPALLAEDQLGTVGVLTLAFGGIVGPSLGHFYAENRSQAWWGIGIRATSSAVFVGAGVWALNETDWFGDDEDSAAAVPSALALTAFLTFAASGLFDIFNAPDSANDYNARHGLNAQVLPQYHPATEGVGLAVRISL